MTSSDDEFAAAVQASSGDASSKYDPNKVYAHSTDGKGHGEKVRVGAWGQIRFPNEVLAAVSAMIARGDVAEYRTTHDFIRDAVVHHLHNRRQQIEQGVFANRVGAFIRLAEAEHLAATSAADKTLIESREVMFQNTRDPEMIAKIVEACKEDVRHLSTEYSREAMRRLIRAWER